MIVEILKDATFIGVLSLERTVVKVESMLPALITAKGLGMNGVQSPISNLAEELYTKNAGIWKVGES
ncbi:hypothetical protein ACIQ4Z_17560 [Peribacillus asahii]|uniref:hypothetical protein n=1 Tax=Peribacillus asahii TaxID=228899 RepID=UPI0037FE43D5